MSPINRTSPILSALARSRTQTKIPRTTSLSIRQAHTHVGTVSRSKFGTGARSDWGAQWKKVGSVGMMYVPVVAIVMFWPYAVEPVMKVFGGI